MALEVGEVWSDVPPLPDVQLGEADLYLRFPTAKSVERTRQHLARSGYAPSTGPNAYFLQLSCVEPLPALRCVMDTLSAPERADTLAILRPIGTEMEQIDKLAAMSVDKLCNRLAAIWLVELLRSRSLLSIFQPIVEPGERETVKGYEALSRGYRGREEVDAKRMFAVAESAHLAAQLDVLAMQTALATAAENNVAELLFINCSPGYMHDPYTRMAEVAAYVHRLGLRPSKIVFEVVETERLDGEHLHSFVLAAHRYGFRVALDDLGAGYSSLTRLADLHPDIIKFDRGLVSSINDDPYRAVIFNRLLDASRVLALETVVEGVETEAELAWARANGATYVQGNLIGKPSALRNAQAG